MIEFIESPAEHVLAFKISGKLHDADYKTFVPAIDEMAKTGKVRLLAEFHDFQGWDMHALWDDIKFATSHCRTIEKVALVGDKAWEKWMAKVCVPFSMAKIRYFDQSESDAARAWIQEA